MYKLELFIGISIVLKTFLRGHQSSSMSLLTFQRILRQIQFEQRERFYGRFLEKFVVARVFI